MKLRIGFGCRLVLAAGILGISGVVAPRVLAQAAAAEAPAREAVVAWDPAPVLARISAPEFPDRDFSVVDHGARGDGETDCRAAFAEAIRACHEAGGGRVVVPEGRFLVEGPIHLKSNVNLHLSEGAVVLFGTDPEDYLPAVFTRWEGIECMNYSPMVYAYGQENIAITGAGTLDGQGSREHWWPWSGAERYGWQESTPRQNPGRDRLFEMGQAGVPVAERVLGEGGYLRPNMIQPYACRNVLIEGVTVRNSPMWHLHPTLCTNVIVRGVSVIGHGPNNDGCNPESSKDVLIEDCYFDTGDDCIAIKSGRNNDGRRVNVASENIIVRDCRMKEGHGGVVMGSEISGSVRNVYVENCVMDSPNLDRALRIKSNSYRGGRVENVVFRNVRIGQVGEAVVKINFFYENGDGGEHTPSVHNVYVADVTCEKSRYGVLIAGYDRAPVSGVLIENCRISEVQTPLSLIGVDGLELRNVAIQDQVYNETFTRRLPDAVTAALDREAADGGDYIVRRLNLLPRGPSTVYEFQIRQTQGDRRIRIAEDGAIQ